MSHIAADQFGDLVARRDPAGEVTIVEAPEYTRVSLGFLLAADGSAVQLLDGCLVLAGQVWYRPVEFDPTSLVLICRKVRDDRLVVDPELEPAAALAP